MAGSGDLNERVTIQRLVITDDGAGGQVRSWSDLQTVWAQVLPAGVGDEAAIGDGVQGVQGFRIKVRFRRDITIENRIIWREQELNVLAAVDETGKRQYTVIRTDAGVVTE